MNNLIKIIILLVFAISLLNCNNKDIKHSNENSEFINNIPFILEEDIMVWKNKNNELVAYTKTSSMKHIFIL